MLNSLLNYSTANAGIDSSTMMPIMYILIGAMIVAMVAKMMKDMFKKKKKEVEIPRDTMERLTKAYRTMARGGLNRNRVRHTLWMSGDKYFQGYRLGDIVALQPQNEEFFVYVKFRWWYFWRKAIPVKLDVELCTDWNCRDIVAEARGIEAVTESEYYLVPCYGVPHGLLETAYIQRYKNRMVRVLKQSILDADVDTDCVPKIALRGDIVAAMSEVGRFEEMPMMTEDEIKRQQKHAMKEMQSPGGGQ